MDQQTKPSDAPDMSSAKKSPGRPKKTPEVVTKNVEAQNELMNLASELLKTEQNKEPLKIVTPRQDVLAQIITGVAPLTLLTQETITTEDGRRIRGKNWEINEDAVRPYLVIADWILDQ